ncbi:MAG TPA: T9SS type A sorting domain-containing protein, partial [Gammaproteobacteria bacterium]|nr:T9SS type A sorting domain-containing protein [Gammaproteobacteria bacterium]
GTTGLVSASNSLVGSNANDLVGFGGITPLVNGNYVIASPDWDNGATINTGAVTWCDGATGRTGAVSASNSLVGSTASDQVGTITALSNSNFLVLSPIWDNGVVTDVGAATWGNGSTLLSGTINSCNSVSGSVTGSINSTFNGIYGYLLVGVPASNRVVIYNPSGQTLANHLDVVSTSITGSNEVPFVTNPSCRIIGTLKPNGASPVNGTVNAQAWIESSVPSFGGQPFVARHYEITPASNPSTATGRITLYFTQQEFTDFNNDPGSLLNLPTGSADASGKANLRIEKRSGTSSNGTGLPGSYSGINTTIDPADADIVWNATLNRWEVSFEVTGFSGFFVKTTLTVLPLTLLEFNGRLQNGNALLNWKTENELNTDQFLVERSIDGRNFTVVGTVDAKNQPGFNLYNHIDAGVNTLAASMVYYRLKQTDIDSRFTYSRIIALQLDKQNKLLLYPNPATDQLMITLSAERAEKVQVRIVDNAGRVLRQQQWNSIAGSVTMPLEVSSLAKGMYYLEVKGENTDQRKIFVKL